VIDTGRRAVK